MTVKQIQNLLQYLGYYNGIPDGDFGPLSRQAVTDFQRAFGLKVDGDPGPETQKALTHAVAYGMPERKEPDTPAEDINVPGKTGSFWDEIEFFDREEFRCQCNGQYCDGFHVEPEETMVRICDEIRRRAGVPILIRDAGGSGLRCPEWNAAIKGAVANSPHTDGKAADLHPRGKTPEQLHAIAEEVMAEMIPGRGGLGIYNWGIHVDTGKYSRWDNRG